MAVMDSFSASLVACVVLVVFVARVQFKVNPMATPDVRSDLGDVRVISFSEFTDWLRTLGKIDRARVTMTIAQAMDNGSPLYVAGSAAYFAEQTGRPFNQVLAEVHDYDESIGEPLDE